MKPPLVTRLAELPFDARQPALVMTHLAAMPMILSSEAGQPALDSAKRVLARTR